MAEYINVTTLNLLAKQVLEQCEPLNNLIVCGGFAGKSGMIGVSFIGVLKIYFQIRFLLCGF